MIRHRLALGIFIAVGFLGGIHQALASTNISATSTSHWAWNDLIGWIDLYNTQTITVATQNLTGYASSSVGDISLDCHTTSIGNICSTSNYQVTNDGSGNLSGWAWNDQYGWISFDCHNNNGCGTSNYEVYVDSAGDFQNYAWNDILGWTSFNCANTGGCGTSNYKVNTSWRATSTTATLDSSIFDTGVNGGAQLNSVLWHGSQPADTAVFFQFAASSASSGPWSFVGSDGTSNTNYAASPAVSSKIGYAFHNNKRYFRYRVFLQSNLAQTQSPRVDDIIVNWSP
ncbi:MAG: hypothetical protein HY434_01835 [Candidatus Liptonbacteria bacterium]|nr:hypothetical protein [Candidatus Liptonbacteria bacterium]